MNWYANTLFPIVEEACVASVEPITQDSIASACDRDGHHDVAGYIDALSDEEFSDVLRQCMITVINEDRPDYDDELTDVELDAMFLASDAPESGESPETTIRASRARRAASALS